METEKERKITGDYNKRIDRGGRVRPTGKEGKREKKKPRR